MPKGYTKSNPQEDQDQSDYESDGGTRYRPDRKIFDRGGYDIVRKLLPDPTQPNKEKLVLSYRVDKQSNVFTMDQARRKTNFYNTFYGQGSAHLFFPESSGYRLVVDRKHGVTLMQYLKTHLLTKLTLLVLLKKILMATQKAHRLGLVMIDLKEDNLLIDGFQNIHLIDGGHSAEINTPLPVIFKRSSEESIVTCQEKLPFFAPECWHLTGETVLASPAMDVYAIGDMMLLQCKNSLKTIPGLYQLILRCVAIESNDRPSIQELLDWTKQELTMHQAEIQRYTYHSGPSNKL